MVVAVVQHSGCIRVDKRLVFRKRMLSGRMDVGTNQGACRPIRWERKDMALLLSNLRRGQKTTSMHVERRFAAIRHAAPRLDSSHIVESIAHAGCFVARLGLSISVALLVQGLNYGGALPGVLSACVECSCHSLRPPTQ